MISHKRGLGRMITVSNPAIQCFPNIIWNYSEDKGMYMCVQN